MTRWKYTVISASGRREFIELLNAYGYDGWEAISGSLCVGDEKTLETYIEALGRSTTVEGPHLWVAVMKCPVT